MCATAVCLQSCFLQTWEESDWDKPGYNPKNGKIRALFRWEHTHRLWAQRLTAAERLAFLLGQQWMSMVRRRLWRCVRLWVRFSEHSNALMSTRVARQLQVRATV